MEKFNVGDWVYASDWCYGCITEIEDGFAVVEFDTDFGGGNCSFMLKDLKKAETPDKSRRIRMTLADRFKRAVYAFKGNPIGNLYFGVDIKRCDQCEYKNVPEIRDNLLVTAGARAAYMNYSDKIDIPDGIEEEFKLYEFLTKVVDDYLRRDCGNFDLYLETKLTEKYGGNT